MAESKSYLFYHVQARGCADSQVRMPSFVIKHGQAVTLHIQVFLITTIMVLEQLKPFWSQASGPARNVRFRSAIMERLVTRQHKYPTQESAVTSLD